jgi:thioredoxin reductase
MAGRGRHTYSGRKRGDGSDDDNLIAAHCAGAPGDPYEVAIIGAGYAGLACALMLGRYLVPTVIFDGGPPRNHSTRRVHGYLGFEGASPQTLLKKAWQDVNKFGSRVTVVKARVLSARKGAGYFSLQAAVDGGGTSSSHRTYRARQIVIATGVQDIRPAIRNFAKFDGDGAWHCPHCDGHEVTGRRLALIVRSGERPLSYAKEFFGWTRDITLFLQPGGNNNNDSSNRLPLDEREQKEAAELGIKVIADRVVQMTGRQGNLGKSLLCASGRRYQTDVIFYKLGYRVQGQLAEQLGCELDGGYVKVGRDQQTTVERVYAAGDIDLDRHYVVLAAAAGARAAMSIYEKLLSQAVEQEKRENSGGRRQRKGRRGTGREG